MSVSAGHLAKMNVGMAKGKLLARTVFRVDEDEMETVSDNHPTWLNIPCEHKRIQTVFILSFPNYYHHMFIEVTHEAVRMRCSYK